MHDAHALGHEVIRSARPNDLTPHAATKKSSELNQTQAYGQYGCTQMNEHITG